MGSRGVTALLSSALTRNPKDIVLDKRPCATST